MFLLKLTEKQILEKEADLKYIKQFRKISIMNVCEDLGIDYHNVVHGKASYKKIRRVRKEIEKRVEAWLHRYD